MQPIQTFNRSVLNLVINSYYDDDYDGLRRLGIDNQTAQRIALLPSSVRYRLEKLRVPIMEVMVNTDALNSTIDTCMASSGRDEMYDQAIRLGASKQTMHDICKMSSARFAARRKALGISDNRVRPQVLMEEEEVQLYQVAKQEQHDDDLQRLIFLAEQTGIEINRIYNYFAFRSESQ